MKRNGCANGWASSGKPQPSHVRSSSDSHECIPTARGRCALCGALTAGDEYVPIPRAASCPCGAVEPQPGADGWVFGVHFPRCPGEAAR